MTDLGSAEPVPDTEEAEDDRVRGAVAALPLDQLARLLLDTRMSGDDLFDGGPGGDAAYRLLLELLCHDPRRMGLVELSAAADLPIADVFRAVSRLAGEGLVGFVGESPTLREHEIGLTEPGRVQIEQHLRGALRTLSDLLAEGHKHAA